MTTRRWRRLARLGFVLTLGAAAAALATVAFSSPKARLELFVSPAGNDRGPCTKRAPCRSLGQAYALAAAGATIEVAGGGYPAQTIPALAKGGPKVVVRPAPKARVTITGLTIEGASNLRLQGLRLQSDMNAGVPYGLLVDACSADVTLVGVGGDRFFIMEGTRRIAFRGGRWGGYAGPGHEDSAIGTSGVAGPTRTCAGKPAAPARDISFSRVTFSDVFWHTTPDQWGGAHPDCFEINGYVEGLTIRDSRFLRCGDSFLAIYGDQGDVVDVLIERSIFQDLGDTTWYGMQWTSEGKRGRCGSIVFRDNVYRPNNPRARAPYSPMRTECVPPAGARPVEIVDNTFQKGPDSYNCAKYRAKPFGTIWRDNRFEISSPCGAGAKLVRKRG